MTEALMGAAFGSAGLAPHPAFAHVPEASSRRGHEERADSLDWISGHLRAVPDIELSGRVYGGGLHGLERKELGEFRLPEGLINSLQALTGGREVVAVQKPLPFTS